MHLCRGPVTEAERAVVCNNENFLEVEPRFVIYLPDARASPSQVPFIYSLAELVITAGLVLEKKPFGFVCRQLC
jgi:hypothetical protein